MAFITEEEYNKKYGTDGLELGAAPLGADEAAAYGGMVGMAPQTFEEVVATPPPAPAETGRFIGVDPDLFLTREQADLRRSIYSSLELSLTENPDQFATYVKQAKETGLPLELFGNKEIQQEANRLIQAKGLEEFLSKGSGKLREWVLTPQNFEVSKDDTESLTNLESMLHADSPFMYEMSPYQEKIVTLELPSRMMASFQGKYYSTRLGVVEGQVVRERAGQLRLTTSPQEIARSLLGTEEEYRKWLVFRAKEMEYRYNDEDLNWAERLIVGAAGQIGQYTAWWEDSIPTGMLYHMVGTGLLVGTGVGAGAALAVGGALYLAPKLWGSLAQGLSQFQNIWNSETYGNVLDYQRMQDITGKKISLPDIEMAASLTAIPQAALEYLGQMLVFRNVPVKWRPFRDAASKAVVLGALEAPSKMPMVRYLLQSGAAFIGELAEEGLQKLTGSIGGRLLKGYTGQPFVRKEWSEDVYEALSEAKEAVWSFGLLHFLGMGSGLTTYVESYRDQQASYEAFRGIAEGTSLSLLHKRSQEKYKEAVDTITKDGPKETTYIDIRRFNTYWQSKGIDPRQAADDLGIADQYDQAVAELVEQDALVDVALEEKETVRTAEPGTITIGGRTITIDETSDITEGESTEGGIRLPGEKKRILADLEEEIEDVAPYGKSDNPLTDDSGIDLAIPTSAYAAQIAGTEHHAGLVNDLKFSADGMTARQATEQQKRVSDWIANAMKKFSGQRARLQDVQQVFLDKLSQILDDPQEAADASRLYALAAMQAEEAGAIPDALEDAKGLVFQRDADGKIQGYQQNAGEWAYGGLVRNPTLRRNLTRAKIMRTKGKRTADYIYRETGWFVGPDGQWRFVIDDSKARIIDDGSGRSAIQRIKDGDANGFNLHVEELMDHPDLFNAYPYIAGMSITIMDGASGASFGGYPPSISMGTLSVQRDASEKTDAEVLNDLLHEIQHGIQGYEGIRGDWARGGSMKMIEDRVDALKESYSKASGEERSKLEAELAKLGYAPDDEHGFGKLYDAYLRIWGEVEARVTEARAKYTEKQLAAETPLETAEKVLRNEGLLTGDQTLDDVLLFPDRRNHLNVQYAWSIPERDINTLYQQGDTDAEYMAAVEAAIVAGEDNDDEIEVVQEMVYKAAEDAGYGFSHRRNTEKDPRSTGHVILFARDRDMNEGYGDYEYVARLDLLSKVPDWAIEWHANSEEMKEWAEFNEVTNEDEIYEQAYREMNPNKIVDTALFWDDPGAISRFWEENEDRLVSEKIAGFKTPDGAVVFDAYNHPEVVKSAAPISYDDAGNVIPLSERFDTGTPDIRYQTSTADTLDAEYLAAVEAGDMEAAQKLVLEAARAAGYLSDSDYRMQHRAPNSKDDVNLLTLRGSGLVPEDYWAKPEWYQHAKSEWASWRTVTAAMRKMDAAVSKGKDPGAVTIMMYRAVPKTVTENSFRNGDWVTPSRADAVNEGQMIPEGYRIISRSVPVKDLYWDGNSINEWGYDDGQGYGYQNTPNNRKLLEAVTRDDAGNVIPLSERFDTGTPDIRYQTDTSPRGAYTVTGEGERIITLFSKADASTVIHEFLGHHIIERYLEAERLGTLSEQAKADMDVLRSWAGSTDGTLSVDQKEQIAEAWEKYLMEGKAPSAEIAGVFERFKRKLLEIYRVIRSRVSQIILTDELISVFDRMLIAQDELDDLKELQGYDEAVRFAEESGASEEDVQALARLVSQADIEAHREVTEQLVTPVVTRLKTTVADRRKKLKAEMTEVVRNSHVYRMRNAMRRPGSTIKFAKQEILDTWGEEGLQAFKGFYAVNGTISLDEAVGMFGFESSTEMRELARSAPSVTQAIRDAVTRKLADELTSGLHGDAMKEITQMALHSETRLEAIILERLILDSRTTEQNMAAAYKARSKALLAHARRQLLSRKAKGLNPKKYFSAEARWQRKYEEAVRDGDLDAAQQAKDLQGLNFAMGMASMEASKALKKADKDIRKYARRGRKTLGLPLPVLDAIDNLLERVDLRGRNKDELQVIRELEQYVNTQQQKGETPMLPPETLRSLGKKRYQEMSVGEVLELGDAIKSLVHIGQFEQKMLSAELRQKFDELVFGLVEQGGKTKSHRKGETINDATFYEPVLRGLREFHDAHMKVDFLINILDRATSGPFRDAIWNPLNNAAGREQQMLADAAATFKEIMTRRHTKQEVRRWRKQRLNTDGAFDATFTKENLLMIALNWGNGTNRDRVMVGYDVEAEQVEALFDKYLEERDWQMVQNIWDFIDAFWPEIEKLHADMTGVRPAKVDALPVQTKYGEFAGGYFPIAYSKKLSHAAFFRAQKEEDLLSTNYFGLHTAAGHTKLRMQSVGQQFKLELHLTPVLGLHLRRVIHDLAFRRALRDVNRIVTDESVAATITDVLGSEGYRQFRPWLIAIAGTQFTPVEGWGRFIARAKTGATVVSLGLRFAPAISQIFGYLATATHVGTLNTLKYLTDFLTHPMQWSERAEFVKGKSQYMKFRESSFDQDVTRTIAHLTENGMMDSIKEAFFAHIGMMDAMVTIPTWYGVYHDALAEGLSETQAAVEKADTAIRQTQNTGRVIDTSAIQRGHPALTIFTMFYSYMNTLYNMHAVALNKIHSVKDVPRYLSFLMLAFVLEGIGQSLLRGNGPDDDDDDGVTLWEWISWGAKNTLGNITGTMVGIRDIFGVMNGYRYQFSPAVAPVEQFSRLVSAVLDLNTEDPDTFKKVLKTGWGTAEYWWGIPTKQVRQSAGHILDAIFGDEEFSLRKFIYNR